MKNKLTTILAMLLCAILTITGIGIETAYAAEKTPIKITFNKKTVTLAKNINTKPKQPDFKTLKSKWGKPEANEIIAPDWNTYEDRLYGIMYSWKKGESGITYHISETPRDKRIGSDRTYITIGIFDKNIKVNGVTVGTKQKKAEKILKKLTKNDGEFSESDIRISYTCEDGKVSSIRIELEDL